MRPTITIVAVLLVLELGGFYWQYRDIVLLNRPAEALAADEEFPELARAALGRRQISRRTLERVALVAGQRREGDLRVQALERIVASAPEDPHVRLRLAEALRDAGRLDEAERMYRQELGLGDAGGAR